jgi:T5SS/PEP-CTERM-associated repeat protein/autotransporter-associated beta strand protein
VSIFAAAVTAALLPRPAAAQSVWTDIAGGNWNVSDNWVGGTIPVPGATTALIFGDPTTQAATYTATNNIANPFNLNALTVNNTAGTVTIAGDPLTFTGTNPTITVSGAGGMVVSSAVTLAATTTVAGAGTGGFTFSGAAAGGANNLVKTSSGQLTLAAGGTMNQLSVQGGTAFATGGTLALTNPNNADNSSSGLQLGAAAGQTGNFTASGGAVVNVTENIYVGDAVGSTGTLTVTGAGTVMNNTSATSGRFGVGNGGTGTLNVTNGGTVNTNQLFAARLAGGTGTVLVDGTGSVLHTIAQLSFGTAGLGTMTVQNGGSARADSSVFIGRAVGAGINGVVTVTGAGSNLTAGITGTAGLISVGTAGPGTLNVENGGAAVTNSVFSIGTNAGGAGQVTVTGTGSTITAAGALEVGSLGSGTLTADNGATVTVGAAATPAALAAITVGDAGSGTMNVRNGAVVSLGSTTTGGGQFALGAVGPSTGTVNIQTAGRVNVFGSAFVGVNTGEAGTLTVDGPGSTFSVTEPNATAFAFLVLSGGGQAGGGTTNVAVTGGGTLTVEVLNAGQNPGGMTTITVGSTTPGSTSNLNALAAQFGGAGANVGGAVNLTVGPGGAVTVDDFASVYGGATLAVAGGALTVGALFDGTATSVGAINLTAGRLTIDSDVTNGSYAGTISGAGNLVKAGAATQTLAGDHTYAGGTTISGGTLLVTNTSGFALGSGPVNVQAGGTLGGTGLIGGPVTVAGGVSPGTSVGTLRVDAMTWQGGGRYDFEFAGATGDLVSGTGNLNLSSLTSGSRFAISIASFDAALTTPQTYTIASFAGGITGFDPTAGNPQFQFSGFFVPGSASVAVVGNNLQLTFTPVPEPAHLLLFAGAGLAVRWWRRRTA